MLASRVPFLQIYANSLLVAVVVTVGQLVTCTLAAFAFARLNFRGRDALFFILLVGLMFPAQVTILPIYLGYAQVGLINQPIGLALMYLTSSFGVFLMRQFMLSQPKALEEAALMDGAGYFKIFWRISLPQLRPGAFGARHHHLHPDLELLFPGARAARQGAVDDAAGRHGRAARLPGVRQSLGRHGRHEHVDPAGRAALPRRPALRDRRHHDERHQELEPQSNPASRTDFMWDDLASIDPRFAYKGERTRYIAFPLGGVGSGGFSISGSGRLIDWSIRNRPALQGYNGYSHFAIKAEKGGELVDARVLNGPYDLNPSGAPGLRKMFDGFGHGANRQTLVGVPHFREVDFYGRFPTADLVFKDERFPGGVRLTALSPFIPHNDRDSSMPVAMFEFELVNDTGDELTYTLAGTLGNYGSNSGIHTFERKDGVSTLHLTSSDQNLKPADRGDLTIATDADDVDHTDHPLSRPVVRRPRRVLEGVCDAPAGCRSGTTTSRGTSRHMSLQPEHGTLAARVTIPAGGRKKMRFVISWSFPIGDIYWAFRSSARCADPRPGDADLAQLLRQPLGGLRKPAPATR